MKGFYSLEDFPIPSVWKTVDNDTLGLIAFGKNARTNDILIRYTLEGQVTSGLDILNYYEIQYRYYEVI